jgi:HD superfamily phosphohydrolase
MAKKHERLIADDALEPFYEGIDTFCQAYLPASPKENEPYHGHKIIADPVEGYSSLESWEIGIVDTPLFQRQRWIRQLGLAFLVYPTLGYSRFEHVIGVRARLEQISTVLKHNSTLRGEPGQVLPTDTQLTRMRLAVLCHDIGHCLFSHVSETVLETLQGSDDYPSGETISEAFRQYAGRRIPMAEILSVAILTSPPFIAHLNRIGAPDAQRRDRARKLAFEAANLIMGLPIPHDPTSLFLGQLMNSGLDIDKLDYMLRESLLSGITLGISLGWLMKKLFIATVSGSRVPIGLRTRLGGFPQDDNFSVLAIERGGQFAFEEFCVARLTLHEKIYLHQKIRAAEVQARQSFTHIAREVPQYAKAHQWLYLKESFGDYPDADLPALPERDLFTQTTPRNARVFHFDSITRRDLLSRAYAFGWQNSIADPLLRASRELAIDKLMTAVTESQPAFIKLIRNNMQQIVSLLDVNDIYSSESPLLLDPPRLSTIQQGQDTIHIEYPPRLSLRWTMPIDRIEEYYHRNRALGYVFTEIRLLPYVMLASEKVAWDEFKVLCVQDGLINKRVVDEAKELRIQLSDQGFYNDAVALKPISGYLAGLEAQSLVSNIAEQLASYESRMKERVSPASVTTFVAQFPNVLQPGALSWLQHIQFIRPDVELCRLIPQILSERLKTEMKAVGISPLGATTDSAYHIAYDLRESLSDAIPREIRAPQVPLAEALGMHLDYYVIFDDNTNSGLQALNIVASWLDKKLPRELTLDEDHVQALQPALADEFLSKPVSFCFATAPEGGPKRLKRLLMDHLGFSDDLVHCAEQVTLPASRKIFNGPNSQFQHADIIKLREFVVDVARTILLSEGKTVEVAEKRALGYGNAEAMVVFPYNCPTMTIPALWLTGKYRGITWHPLVERGRRTNALTGEFTGEDA